MHSDTSAPTPELSAVRELRLGIVLYGGASLAIYMHGTTKELQRLVKASALADRGVTGTTPTEKVYGDLLAELASRDPERVRTRVVVDVVAGTSAGGINGVYLSKSIAHNRSQDALRGLWFKRGDIKVLLRGPSWVPALVKVPFLLAGAVKRAVLRGDAIAVWMYDALREMDAGGSQPDKMETLMPPRHPLELFITVTDFYGYRRDLVISDPPTIRDTAHRHVLGFKYGDGTDQFDAAHNGALAFAARTTMSFPGAFPPVSLGSFHNAVRLEAGDLSELLPDLFRIYELSSANPAATYFVDGGVLDNKPFGYVIAAIKQRGAELEVDRRLLYLQPDPGNEATKKQGGKSPNPIATVLASVSGLPRQEPVLDDIQEINRHNERVRRISDIIETSFESVGQRVTEIVGTDLGRLTADESPEEVARWRDQINAEAKATAGFAYATYVRSKVSGVAESFARTICRLANFPDLCNQAGFVRNVVRSWAETRLLPVDTAGRRTFAPDTEAFLRRFDLGYRARRLRFVTDGISGWYRDVGRKGYPTRAELNEGKRILYASRDELLDAMDGRGLLTNLTEDVLAVFAQAPIDAALSAHETPDEYAAQHLADLVRLENAVGAALDSKLAGTAETLYRQLFELSASWAPERRAELLVRYLGFPFWDLILYPIQSLADAGECDAIDVVRMSPHDSKLLPLPDPDKPKLAGFSTMHFGAFFDRAGRERDYLWGRLDGAERLIGLLLRNTFTDEERTEWCRKAFAAIVAEEETALKNAKPLVEHVKRFAAGRPNAGDGQ
jgi:patatin-related protein